MKAKKQKVYEEKPNLPSLVPPWLAALLSAIVPGLGQALARAVTRGLVIFFSFVSMVGLLIWRFQDAAPRDEGVVDIVLKAFRLEPIFILISILFVLFYIWIIVDAYILAKIAGKPTRRKPILVFVLLLLVFFVIGWQIGQIDLYTFFTQFDDALPAISRVLWPWERAITYPEEQWQGTAIVETPCDDTPPPPTEPLEEEPYLVVEPTCGVPSEQQETEEGTVEIVPGTVLTVQGYNYVPNEVVEIWWRDPATSQFRHREQGDILRVTPDENGYFEVELTWPYRLIPDIYTEGGAVWELQGRQVISVGEWVFSEE